jgi:hypothetical protein
MEELQQEPRTVAVKTCVSCVSGLLDRDRFCRWCGERQPERMASTPEQVPDKSPSGSATYTTSLLTTSARAEIFRRVSAPLVNAVVTGAVGEASMENQSAFVKRVILGLISIPIWLIIVLLSPLDAYAAVRSLAR